LVAEKKEGKWKKLGFSIMGFSFLFLFTLFVSSGEGFSGFRSFSCFKLWIWFENTYFEGFYFLTSAWLMRKWGKTEEIWICEFSKHANWDFENPSLVAWKMELKLLGLEILEFWMFWFEEKGIAVDLVAAIVCMIFILGGVGESE
jgi:hypothetical protein